MNWMSTRKEKGRVCRMEKILLTDRTVTNHRETFTFMPSNRHADPTSYTMLEILSSSYSTDSTSLTMEIALSLSIIVKETA